MPKFFLHLMNIITSSCENYIIHFFTYLLIRLILLECLIFEFLYTLSINSLLDEYEVFLPFLDHLVMLAIPSLCCVLCGSFNSCHLIWHVCHDFLYYWHPTKAHKLCLVGSPLLFPWHFQALDLILRLFNIIFEFIFALLVWSSFHIVHVDVEFLSSTW